jgi:hypothetical protein
MNIINMPGFNAEASVYKPIRHYASSASATFSSSVAVIQPQYFCGPCVNGRRQCVEPGGYCVRNDPWSFTDYSVTCYGWDDVWSEPCAVGTTPTPPWRRPPE